MTLFIPWSFSEKLYLILKHDRNNLSWFVTRCLCHSFLHFPWKMCSHCCSFLLCLKLLLLDPSLWLCTQLRSVIVCHCWQDICSGCLEGPFAVQSVEGSDAERALILCLLSLEKNNMLVAELIQSNSFSIQYGNGNFIDFLKPKLKLCLLFFYAHMHILLSPYSWKIGRNQGILKESWTNVCAPWTNRNFPLKFVLTFGWLNIMLERT